MSDESNASQTKYGWIKGANFLIGQRNYGCKIMIQKCIQKIWNVQVFVI